MAYKWTDIAFAVFVVVGLVFIAVPKFGRYEVRPCGINDTMLVKIDTWTGEAWVVHAVQARTGEGLWRKIEATP